MQWYYFGFIFSEEKLDINGLAIQNSFHNALIAESKQEGKIWIGFKASLFCGNWKFLNTCESSSIPI